MSKLRFLANTKNALLVVCLLIGMSACTTADAPPEDDILSEVVEEASSAAANDEEIIAANDDVAEDDGFEDEGFGEEMAAEEGSDDGFGDEGGGEDESFGSDESLGEEPAEQGGGEDSLANEEPADQSGGEDGFASEEPAEEATQSQPEEPLGDESYAQEPAEEPFSEEPLQATGEAENAQPVDIQNIKYMGNKQGGAVEIVTSGSATFKTRMNPETNQFVIEVANANLPENLKRPYIMKEFEGAFAAINAYQDGGSKTARIVIQLKEAFEPSAQLEGSSIVVLPSQMAVAGGANEAPAEPAQLGESADSYTEEPPMDNWNAYEKSFVGENDKILSARTLDDFLTGDNKFYGKKLSIEINNSEVKEVIKFIAEFSGANIVLSEDVKGKVTIKLRQVPWDQALVTVMRAHNLGYIREGNVLRISNLKTLQEEAQAANAIVAAQKGLAPLKVKVIPVSFALVKDLEQQLQKFLTKNRGQIVSDDRTSSLIITDTIDVLDRVSRLVKELDIPPAQVLIEGKIVEASESFTKQIGVNWSFNGAPKTIGSGFKDSPLNLTTGLTVRPVTSNVAEATTTSLDLSVGTLDFFGTLSATLALAETDQLVKVVSAPRILAMNRQKASISQKGQVVDIIPTVQPNSGVVTPTIERNDVALQLDVTPQITSSGSVILDVDVLRQFPGADLSGEGAREINSRQAKTKVLVKNGQTAVIGGIYQSDMTQTKRGTPWLRDVPFLGWLFKNQSEDNRKNELLLFLTPRILNAKDLKAKDVNSL